MFIYKTRVDVDGNFNYYCVGDKNGKTERVGLNAKNDADALKEAKSTLGGRWSIALDIESLNELVTAAANGTGHRALDRTDVAMIPVAATLNLIVLAISNDPHAVSVLRRWSSGNCGIGVIETVLKEQILNN